MVTVVQGKVCAKNHPDRLSRLATIHQRYRQTDRRISYGIGLDLTVGQKNPGASENAFASYYVHAHLDGSSGWKVCFFILKFQHLCV